MDADWEFIPANQDFAESVHRLLADECGYEYDLGKSALFCTQLSFYPEDVWLCHLDLSPQTMRIGGRSEQLKETTRHYMVCRPSDQKVPIVPLGNDPAWVLRANRYYGLYLRAGGNDGDDPDLSMHPVDATDEQYRSVEEFRRIMDYLHFYYRFTRYAGFPGGPTRFRVPRRLNDVMFTGGTAEDRAQVNGALWRFDPERTGFIHPAVGTVTRSLDWRSIDWRYHADVPIQVMRSLWQLRVTISKTGYVRLFRRVPFFASRVLDPPRAEPHAMLPVPRGLVSREPWLRLPERTRASLGVFAHSAFAVSWLLAALVSVGFSLTLLLHPALTKTAAGPLFPIGWSTLWWSSFYAIGVFGILSACVFQFDGVLTHVAHVAPGMLQALTRFVTRVHDKIWGWFRPKLETPLRKAATAALWLAVSASFLVLAFTALQVSQDPQRFDDALKGLVVMQTFFGHATIAVPGAPYLLGAVGLDPLPWLRDPHITTGIVFWFRVMMLIVVFRAFWKLLSYTPPRILWRDTRRLEQHLLKQHRDASAGPPSVASRSRTEPTAP